MSILNLLAWLILIALALPALLACAYLLLHTLLSGEPRPLPPSSRKIRFDLVVPAHNEAQGIAATLSNLRLIDWPPDRFRILVVADNCTDSTAAVAAAGGATVLERDDPAHRGKGYALKYAFAHSREKGWADAVAIVDADARVSPNLLESFACRIEQGASAIQADYGVLNAAAAGRTRLMAIAMGAYHIVRSRARERLHLSSGLVGNGWCVTHALLAQVGYNAFSLTEDMEFGIDLGLAGHRVHYAGEAHADQDMLTDGGPSARKQRQRWEQGRFQLIRSRTLPLLRAAVQRRSAVCLNLALDLIVLPLSYVALNVFALLLLAALLQWWTGAYLEWLYLSLGCLMCLALYVFRGWQLSHTGVRGLLDLAGAPAFVAWKVVLMIGRQRSAEWVRTERKSP
jgi:cellulose synthase/poly-beta-1,6-N-acetylglucosamine synthase-like glycosyltransferase